MKCLVCGNEEITASMSECPKCHFEIVRIVSPGGPQDAVFQEAMQGMQAMAQEYAKELKETYSIGLLVYSYVEKDGKLSLDREKQLTILPKASELPAAGIFWYEESFARVESDRPLDLQIYIGDGNEKRFEEISLPVPEEKGLWKIGCKGDGNLGFKIVLGSPEHYSESETISLL